MSLTIKQNQGTLFSPSPSSIEETGENRSLQSLALESINGESGFAEETSTSSSFSQEVVPETQQRTDARVNSKEEILRSESLRDKKIPFKILPRSQELNLWEKQNYKILQKWEGCVEEVKEDTFSAMLYDLQDLSAPDYFCEIYLEEISEADKELVQPGAVFYWHIFYKEEAGRKSRESLIRFRRLPWSKAQREQAKEDARKLNNYFKWDSIESSQRR